MALNIEKERTAFEEWCDAPNGLKRDNNGNYLYAEANNEWRVWKAAKEQAAKQGGWISIKEQAPENYDAPVLVYIPYYGVPITAFPQECGGFADFLSGDALQKEATHWQPLPASPEKE